MSEEMLKPCPFCGAQPFFHAVIGDTTRLECGGDCSMGEVYTDRLTRAEAIAAWNRRPAPPDQAQAREAADNDFLKVSVALDLLMPAGVPGLGIEKRHQVQEGCLAFKRLGALLTSPVAVPAEWREIETAPITATDIDPWARLTTLVWGSEIGVCAGNLHRFEGRAATVSVSHLGGDAVQNWGVTHYMPLPAPPGAPEPQAAGLREVVIEECAATADQMATEEDALAEHYRLNTPSAEQREDAMCWAAAHRYAASAIRALAKTPPQGE